MPIKGKCEACGKEVYAVILAGKRTVTIIKNTGKNNEGVKVFVEHQCEVKDVLKQLEE